MVPNMMRDWRFLISRIEALWRSKNSTASYAKAQLDANLTIYNERQLLDQFFPDLHIRIDMEDFMAKQQSNFNLIEYRLTDEQIEAFEKWVKDAKIAPVQALNYCAEKGIKVSMTFATKQEAWCVSLTGKEENKFNEGATLTTWSDDPFEALFMAIFKATVIFQDGKWSTRKSASRG